MAETLGSMVDKLTIKAIRESTIEQMLAMPRSKFPKKDLKKKLQVLRKQMEELHVEMDAYIAKALRGEVVLKDEKIKLYNKPEVIGRIGRVEKVSAAIVGLSRKNLELWQLEDEARREDVPLSYVGKVKRKIDLTNQSRNDFIDRIDALFELKLRKANRPKPKMNRPFRKTGKKRA